MVPLKFGKLKWKSVLAAITAMPSWESVSEGMRSASELSAILHPIKSIVRLVQFIISNHSKAESTPLWGGLYWTSLIRMSPSFIGVGMGVAVGSGEGVGVGTGMTVGV